MKKIISCLVAVCMAAMSFVTVHCEDNIKVILDGKTLEFDVQPQIIDERTLVPMRVIFEALGAEVCLLYTSFLLTHKLLLACVLIKFHIRRLYAVLQ